MKMPSRAEFTDGSDFLYALNMWLERENRAYAYLRDMFDATKAWDEKPSFAEQIGRGRSVRHVWISEKNPTDRSIEAVIRNLAGTLTHGGLVPSELHHGKSWDGNGWSVYVIAD